MPSSDSVARKIPVSLTRGGKAAIRGLQNRPELNGQLVQLVKLVEDRWKTELLGNDEVLTLAIKPQNLLPVPPSALLVTLPEHNNFPEMVVPLACSIGHDGYGQKGVRLMYSEFLGLEALVPVYHRFFGDPESTPDREELEGLIDQMYGVVTSPTDHSVSSNECVVAFEKHVDLFKQLIRYKCLEDTGKRVQAGFRTDCRVCRILFPYDLE